MFSCVCLGPYINSCNEPGGTLNGMGMDDEIDLHESLRVYARTHLGAAEDPWAPTVKIKQISSENFAETFRYVLERSGWPVLKCGNNKGLKRCLMVDHADHFTWGSKKSASSGGSQVPTTVPLSEIKSVSSSRFNDGPAGANPNCMIIFNINDTHGLKILAATDADALTIIHGFNLLIKHPTHFNPNVPIFSNKALLAHTHAPH
uniref:Uncharacterized protein n=1 Tax=Aureoumbra lagunensis TaxID=44058 RepID=A0A7S3K1D8_9STRA|mmetsp:Transcript_15690/g.20719  ORF Transcript_15690/g.20719 Transcript_15690/m.20719 type:complete len:204 (-) Transcript_15690:113-724(-)